MRSSASYAAATILAVLAVSGISFGQSMNVDISTAFGTPSPSYGGPYGQTGAWNAIGSASASSLVNLHGAPTAVDFDYTGIDSLTGSQTCANEHRLLIGDNFYTSSHASWQLVFTNLQNDDYQVTLYAPANGIVPTGPMTVNGAPVSELIGNCTPVEGTDWVTVATTVTDGTLTIVGTRTGLFAGLAGVQLTGTIEAVMVPTLDGLGLLLLLVGIAGAAVLRLRV